MDAIKFLQLVEKMHDTFRGYCEKCPAYNDSEKDSEYICDTCALDRKDPEKCVKIVSIWAKNEGLLEENMTNAEKFKEVFGFIPSNTSCPIDDDRCDECDECAECKYDDFWDKEYTGSID